MSSSSRRERGSRITENEMNDLILKLQPLLPDYSTSTSNTRVSASKILKETCKYLKKLQKEVDDLSEGLSQLVASGSVDEDTIRALLQR